MPARFLLIDGYNLLHAAGMARVHYGPGDLQRCRGRLLRFLLSKLSAAEIARATVVFDARDPPPGLPSQVIVSGLRVIFAQPHGDADAVIHDWLEEHSAPHRVTLVSSDRQLQRTARRRRAQFVKSEEFFDQLTERVTRAVRADAVENSPELQVKVSGRMPKGQTDYWLRYFGDVPIGDDEPAVEEPLLAQEAPGPAAPASPPKPGAVHRARRKKAANEKPEKRAGKLSAAEVDQWLKEFGDVPEAGELKGRKHITQSDLDRWLAEFEGRDDGEPRR